MGVILGTVGVNEKTLYWETLYSATVHTNNYMGIGTNDADGAGTLGSNTYGVSLNFSTQAVLYNNSTLRTLSITGWSNGTDKVIRHLLNLDTGVYRIAHEDSSSTWTTVVSEGDNLDLTKVWRPAIDIQAGATVTLFTNRDELNYPPPAGALTFDEVLEQRLDERGDSGTGLGGSTGGAGAGQGDGSGGETPAALSIYEPSAIRTISDTEYTDWLMTDEKVNVLMEAKYSDSDITIAGIDAAGMDVSVDGFSAVVMDDLSGFGDNYITAYALTNITDGDKKYYEVIIDNMADKDTVAIGLFIDGSETNNNIVGQVSGSIGFMPNGKRYVDGSQEQSSIETTSVSNTLELQWDIS